jgi:uncharacterized protein (DUF433 family)
VPELAEPAPKNVRALPRYTLTEARALLGGTHTGDDSQFLKLVAPLASAERGEPRLSFEALVALFLNRPAASDRVEHIDGVPVRFYPFTRGTAHEAAPRVIAVDPRYGFGRPIFADSGVRIDGITGRFRAGESVAELADDTGIPAAHIEEAIRFEALVAPLAPRALW